LKGEETVGYSIIDLSTNTTHPFAGLEPSDVQIGQFYLSQAGLDLAEQVIEDLYDVEVLIEHNLHDPKLIY